MPTNPDQIPWEGVHVYRILREKRNGRRYAVVSGWPTPVSEVCRTKFPPLPGRASYCREARRWATRMLRQNKRKRPGIGWIGAYTLRMLRAVEAGKRPLYFWDYSSLLRYLTPKPPRPVPVPIRLNIAGWGRPSQAPAFGVLQAGRSGYGAGGRVLVPDIPDDEDD